MCLVVTAVPASAHTTSGTPRWVTVPAGSYGISRSQEWTHENFRIRVTVKFETIGTNLAWVDYVDVYYWVTSGGVSGGQLYIYNNSKSRTYNADFGDVRYTQGGFRVHVNEWFSGGQGNGKFAVTVEKRNVEFFEHAQQHSSTAVYYVP
jgi:hypothetical protein